MIALAGLYPYKYGQFLVRHAFLDNFGHTLGWWTLLLLELITLVVMDLVVQSIRRVYWPTDQDLMQRIEKDSDIKSIFKDNATAAERGEADMDEDDEERGRDDGRLSAPQQSRTSSSSPHTPRVSTAQEYRRSVRMSHDDYRPRRFTPPAEELERLGRITSSPAA